MPLNEGGRGARVAFSWGWGMEAKVIYFLVAFKYSWVTNYNS